ncbi:MAG: hypothetical protein OHK0022_11900 [Roseiflexaceae bacterium]
MQPVPWDQESTLIDLLCARAEGSDQTKGYTFLGGEAAERLTYRVLDREARRMAVHLQAQGLTGERAVLLLPPGLAYIVAFWGCLYAGVVAVPVYTPRSEASLPRLQTALASADARVVLSTAAQLERLAGLAARLPQLGRAVLLATDALGPTVPEDWCRPAVTPDSLAFLQYTSGSITAPKGVMLSHRNLLHNLAVIHRAFGVTPESRGVSWLPPYHDMGLIGMILEPLYGGAEMTLLSPFDFLQSPLRWLQAISETRATISGGPNFAYDLCVERIKPEQRRELDLSCWTTAFSGAEPVRAETLERFSAAFGECGFQRTAWYPCYGLAEASLMVSGGPRGTAPLVRRFDAAALERHEVAEAPAEQGTGRTLVGCGDVLGGQEVRIVNPASGVELPGGAVGEIWVRGPSVAQGYWGLPEASAETFQARVGGAGPFLRTGDLGFLHGSALFITGRIKDLIIIRGRNLYPQDLEWTARSSHPALRGGDGAAITIDSDGQTRLVIVHEVERRALRTDLAPVAEAVRLAVAGEHAVPVAAVLLLKPGQLPRTSSGKVQRHVCLQRFLEGTFEPVYSDVLGDPPPEPDGQAAPPLAEDDPLMRRLRHLAADLLHLAPAQVVPDRPLLALGLDSLTAIELQFRVEHQFGVQLPAALLFEGASLHDLARAVAEATPPAPLHAAEQVMPGGPIPLSHGQRALWFIHQLAPESDAYHIPLALRLRGPLDQAALAGALQWLSQRHAMLRTRVVVRDGEPLQEVCEEPPALTVLDATGWSEARLAAELATLAAEPFELVGAPPVRLRLLVCGPDDHLLVCVLHHILVDFWSLALMLRELEQGYAAAVGGEVWSAEALPLYGEYVESQRALLDGGEAERLWGYWRARLAEGIPPLELQTDRPRTATPRFQGGAERARIDPLLMAQVRALSRAGGVTPFSILLAAYAALLHRYSGQRRIVIGTPLAGRPSARWAGVVGYFVNPVPLVFEFGEPRSFGQLVAQTHELLQGALAHQGLPLPVLVERLQRERPHEHPALFQAMVIWQQPVHAAPPELGLIAIGLPSGRLRLGNLTAESVPLAQRDSRSEICLALAEAEDRLEVLAEYNRDLFEADTVRRLLRHFISLLAAGLADPTLPLGELPLLEARERAELVRSWQAAALPPGPHQTLPQAFEQRAAEQPTATALIHAGRQFSYRELDQWAERLAEGLRQRGVTHEQRVGVLLERSPELIALILGVLKAGAAYVPLDPAYPAERLALMLDDADLTLLVTQPALAAQTPPARRLPVTVLLDDLLREPAAPQPARPPHPDQLAYVIYTSGSTGQPKGVAISHRSACALIDWAFGLYTPADLTAVLAATSVCFDLSIFEIFAPLSAGCTLVLARDALDQEALQTCDRLTLINTVPSAAAELLRLQAIPASVRVLNLAGEPLTRALADQIYRQTAVERLYNLYGPTEDTTYSTVALVERSGPGAPPIGGPISGSAAYLLDARLEPVPPGVIGELYLSGAGLARGYLHHPDLTAERFLPDPLSPTLGARMYRTGDLAYARADGLLMFVGRRDQQIKLRGFRIELGEIEAALVQHPLVRAAAARVWDAGPPTGPQLLAYVVADSGTTLDPEALRAWLRQRLPAPMLPAHLLVLDALPLTPSGKTDRRALPDPDRAALTAGTLGRHPQTPTEVAVAAIWQDLLGLPAVGLDATFFALGGHSLLVSRMQARLRDTFHVDLPLRSLFESTLAQIALMIDCAMQTALPEEEPPLVPVARDAYRQPIRKTRKDV